MSESSFDVIPFEDIKGEWTKLGSGSFGNVYKGSYLGIDVAIKEVLPSAEYDVAKYFEREWRLMKEARHPNVVLYLGLARAPPPDGRIFIVSEYIENGNLRLYIHDRARPFPWRLRLSFATDICRALAYLHARKCIHRDLKGENLLLTANLRLKITDFGFARIAARSESEARRLTFCGTDAYMSPEILLGTPFGLPTDLFSLGVVFCEIAARRLADDTHFARRAPGFGVDAEEVWRRVRGERAPDTFVRLALDCLKEDPAERPTVKEVLERLRGIELDVLAREGEGGDGHVGSVKFFTGGRRPAPAPRIPSFGVGAVGEESDSEEEDLVQAVLGLEAVDLGSGWADVRSATQPLLAPSPSLPPAAPSPSASDYSTAVVRARASVLTVRDAPFLPSSGVLADGYDGTSTLRADHGHVPATDSMLTIDSFHTASAGGSVLSGGVPGSALSAGVLSGSALSVAGATEGGSTLHAGVGAGLASRAGGVHGHGRSATEGGVGAGKDGTERAQEEIETPAAAAPALLHRFTLIKPGGKRPGTVGAGGGAVSFSPSAPTTTTPQNGAAPPAPAPWSPFDLFFASGLLVARCDLCAKRLGWKPVLECDDCGLRTHIKCGDFAPRNCGLPLAPTKR